MGPSMEGPQLSHLEGGRCSPQGLCDFEPACSSQLQCVVAQADGGAEAGTAVGSEAGIEVGTEACTEAEAEAEAVAGSEAAAWPLRGTGWRRPRRRWRSPGLCG